MASRKLANQHIQVFVRCRPPNSQEMKMGFTRAVDVLPDKEILVNDGLAQERAVRKSFTFDRVFGPEAKQIDVYQAVMGPTIAEVMMGYNCTVFAYGQTGTGKTFTMEGERSNANLCWAEDPSAGIIPRTLQQLFEELQLQDLEFTIRVSFLELYNEELFDLLSAHDDTSRLKIYEDSTRKGSVIIHGLEEITVHNREEVFFILEKGAAKRQTAATLLNAASSRSHTVFSVTVHIRETTADGEELLKTGKLNLVDLAGSENIGRSGAMDRRAREAGNINQSLLTLGRVITALVDKAPHVPYRESKLTRLLQDSLGGRTKTSIIATISPGTSGLDETLSTLDYAHRAKNITNRPEVNQKMTKRALIKEYTEEIEWLRRDLAAAREKNGIFVDQENYRLMETRLSSQSQEILEQQAHIKDLTARHLNLQGLFKKTKQEVAEKSELLQTTTSELQSTKNSLSAAEQVLSKTAAEKQEQAALVQAHSETEAALAATARELVTVTETTTSDIALLQQKLQRTSAIDQTNRERQSQFVSRINTLFGQVERSCSEKLATQQETLGGIESSFDQLSDIVRRHQDIVCAFTSKARRLASTSAAASADILSSLLSIVRASQAEQAAQFGVDLASNRAGLQQLCHSLVAEHTQATRSWLSKHEAQLQALVVLATDTCRLVSTEVAKHRDQQARLTASLLEENVRLHQRLQVNDKEMERLLAAQESRSRQQAEKLSALQQHMAGFAEFFTSTQAAQREAQEQINDIRAASTEACNTQASALKSNAEELVKSSQALITDVAAIQESATRSTSEFAAKAEESLHDLSSIHTMAEDSATAEVARFSQTLANQKASTESRLADCISNVSQAVSAGAEALLCRAQEAKASADNLDSEVAEACDHLVLTCRRGSELTAATKDSADSLHVGIVDDMARCSTTVSGFFGNELQEYTPTGCTPQRREYRFPRSLPRTSPYERILSRVRLTIDGSAAVPQPGSNEIDAAPLELKEQPCSSSSADSLAANATLDKENVHRRAGKPKKVPPQTKKQLRTKNT
ncbi:kinesin-like protein KIF11 [Haemaphysalis longicornis]